MAGTNPLRVRITRDNEEATASGIYGLIVGAAVLVASHAKTAAAAVVVEVVTLTIYWAAERYARIVAERIHEGHRPTWHTVRRQLTTGWEIVTASVLPLLVLVVARLVGTRLVTAEILSLICTTILLCVGGWRMGAAGRLTRWERVASTTVAGMFGVALVALKTLLH
jgi:positive regulator of sigma E activity